MSDLRRRSPLRGASSLTVAEFQLRELHAVEKLRVQALRSRGSRSPAADPLQLPSSPNTVRGTDPFALWRAPDDWLVYSQTLSAEALNGWVAAMTSHVPLAVTNVSSGSVVLELSGARAIDVLMRDCTLDLEGDAIPTGGCAQTMFAQTTVMIHRPADDSWRLFVERSVALHVWDWILDTASAAPASSH